MSIVHEILVPKENADDVLLVNKIFFKSRDKILKNDDLIELETSKTAIVIDSPMDGFVEFLVDKMRGNPALYDVRITTKAWSTTPVFKGKLPRNPKKIPKKYWVKTSRPTSLTSKVNKKGYEYLETFCNGINEIFTFIDSISYSSLEHNVIDMINNLRIPSFDKIQKLVRRLVSGLTDIEKHAMYSILLPRIPIFNQLNQIEKTKNLKPF